MFSLSSIPNIFFGVSAPLEVLAGLAAILIAVFGFKVHHYTSERRFHWFGVAFSLIALSFVASALVHLMISLGLRERLTDLFVLIGYGTFTLYVSLLLAAYILLLAVSMDLTNKKVVLFMLLFSFVAVFISPSAEILLRSFFIFLLIILSFISFNYFEKFVQRTNLTSFLTLTSFTSLTASALMFVLKLTFEGLSNYFYVAAHAFQLGGYLILLGAMARLWFFENYPVASQIVSEVSQKKLKSKGVPEK